MLVHVPLQVKQAKREFATVPAGLHVLANGRHAAVVQLHQYQGLGAVRRHPGEHLVDVIHDGLRALFDFNSQARSPIRQVGLRI